MNTYTFQVEMTCSGCSNAIQRVLAKLEDKVQNVDIDLDTKQVKLDTSMTREEILEVLRKTGKEVKSVD